MAKTFSLESRNCHRAQNLHFPFLFSNSVIFLKHLSQRVVLGVKCGIKWLNNTSFILKCCLKNITKIIMALTATLDDFELIEMNEAFHPKAPI